MKLIKRTRQARFVSVLAFIAGVLSMNEQAAAELADAINQLTDASQNVAIAVVSDTMCYEVGPMRNEIHTRFWADVIEQMKGDPTNTLEFVRPGGTLGGGTRGTTIDGAYLPEVGDTLLLFTSWCDYFNDTSTMFHPYQITGDYVVAYGDSSALETILSQVAARISAISPLNLALSSDLVISGSVTSVSISNYRDAIGQSGSAGLSVTTVLRQTAGPPPGSALTASIRPTPVGSAIAPTGGTSPPLGDREIPASVTAFLKWDGSSWYFCPTAYSVWWHDESSTAVAYSRHLNCADTVYEVQRLSFDSLAAAIASQRPHD